MTNKTTLLIGFLFLVTCGLLYLAISTSPITKKVAPTPTPTPISVNAKTSLSLTTASASESSRTAGYTVAVVVDSTNKVNAVQIELSYDPQKINNITVTPGTFFQQPNTLLKTIDTSNGRLSYALTEQIDLPGHSGHGTVALISFNLVPSVKPTATSLKLLPKSAVTADKILESVLRNTTDITIPLPVISPTVSTAPLNQGSPSAK